MSAQQNPSDSDIHEPTRGDIYLNVRRDERYTVLDSQLESETAETLTVYLRSETGEYGCWTPTELAEECLFLGPASNPAAVQWASRTDAIEWAYERGWMFCIESGEFGPAESPQEAETIFEHVSAVGVDATGASYDDIQTQFYEAPARETALEAAFYTGFHDSILHNDYDCSQLHELAE